MRFLGGTDSAAEPGRDIHVCCAESRHATKRALEDLDGGRIHLHKQRETAERALEVHARGCPAHESVKDAIEITWSVEFDGT